MDMYLLHIAIKIKKKDNFLLDEYNSDMFSQKRNGSDLRLTMN